MTRCNRCGRMKRIKISVPVGRKPIKEWDGFYNLSLESDRDFLSPFGLDDLDLMRVGDKIVIECVDEEEDE